jgi:hypothetical protein
MFRLYTTTSICTTLCTTLSICLIGLIAAGPVFNCCRPHDVKSDACHLLELQNETAFEFEDTRVEFDEIESLPLVSCQQPTCQPSLLGSASLCCATSVSVPVDSQRGPPVLALFN